jgi:hypothetical protein
MISTGFMADTARKQDHHPVQRTKRTSLYFFPAEQMR